MTETRSWVATRKATGEVIGEFFDRKIVDRFNTDLVLVEDIAQYLGRINREIKDAA